MAVELEALYERLNDLVGVLQAGQAQKNGARMVQGNKTYGMPVRIPQQKHSTDMITMPPPNVSTPAGAYEYFPIYDERGPYAGFFQDPNLKSALVNLMVYPMDGLANHIPVEHNNNPDEKHGFLARYNIYQPEGQVEGGPCEPAPYLQSDLDFIKMKFGYGKLARSLNTMDVTNLLLQASAGQFDNFYIIGEWRGVTARPDIDFFRMAGGGLNEGLIKAAAVRRKLAELGQFFQQWIFKTAWTGDPTNSPGTNTKEFLGLYRLINGKYSTGNFQIEHTNGINTPAGLVDALSSHVVNAAGKVVGDGSWSLWQTLTNIERLLYQRASLTGMLPVDWKIYMPRVLWGEIVKHLPCEMVSDGCTIPGGGIEKQFHLNDGGTALFNMTTRLALQQAQALELNGRTYPVILDDTMPYTMTTDINGAFSGYKGDIFFVPFSVGGGERTLKWEYIDYSKMYQELGPLTDHAQMRGWTDAGHFFHMVTELRTCIEMQTEMQMRLIFKSPQLAGRLDNVSVAITGEPWPQAWDGAGNRTNWLIPPTT